MTTSLERTYEWSQHVRRKKYFSWNLKKYFLSYWRDPKETCVEYLQTPSNDEGNLYVKEVETAEVIKILGITFS